MTQGLRNGDACLYIGQLSLNTYQNSSTIQMEGEKKVKDFKKLLTRKEAIPYALLILVIVGQIFYLFNSRSNPDLPIAWNQRQLTIDENARPLGPGPLPEVSQQSIKIPGFAVLRIPSDVVEVSMVLANPEENNCNFIYEIVLNENNESLYASQMVEPGKAIQTVTLSRSLAAGEYSALVKVRTFSRDSLTELNGANLKTTLIVQ